MTGIIILAAGQSSRMGTPKQQLHFNGASLLQHAITAAAASNAEIVVVVLGYMAEALKPVAIQPNIHTAINENWQQGMGSSIRVGISKLIELKPEVKNAIIMLSDQPLITAEILNELIQNKTETGKGIIACSYAGTVGVPALFCNAYFEYLAAMQGDGGAKKILQQFAGDVAIMEFPGGAVDIDTPEDFNKFLEGI